MTEHGPTYNEIDGLIADLTEFEREELATADAAIELAVLFHDAREAKKLTQAEAARRAGVRQQAVSRFEQSDMKLANTKFETLRKYLTSLGYVVGLSIKDAASGALVKEVSFEPTQSSGLALTQVAPYRPSVYEPSSTSSMVKVSGFGAGMMATIEEGANVFGSGSLGGARGCSTFEVNQLWRLHCGDLVYGSPPPGGSMGGGGVVGGGLGDAMVPVVKPGNVKQGAAA